MTANLRKGMPAEGDAFAHGLRAIRAQLRIAEALLADSAGCLLRGLLGLLMSCWICWQHIVDAGCWVAGELRPATHPHR